MSKGGKTTTQTTTNDALTNNARNDVWNRGQGVLNDPRYQQLLGGYGAAGQAGVDALASGDFSQFLNPMLDGYIADIMGDFDKNASMASNFVDQRATQAGAFGGSRAAIAQGKAVGDVANQSAQAIAQARYGAYQDAVRQAQAAAGMGLGGYQSLAGMPGSLFDDVFASAEHTQKQKAPGGSMLGGLVGAGATLAGIPGVGSFLGLGGGLPAAPTLQWDDSYLAGIPQF